METAVLGNDPFWGMVIFERVGDGTLQGRWKNNRLSNDSILPEIARKNDGQPQNIDGSYVVSWIEEDSNSISGALTIANILNNTAFSFIWTNGNSEVFRGVGMQIGLNQIAVTYWQGGAGLTLNFR
jgi:hypothetical protein